MSDRLDRYFAQEATDYLEQLEEELSSASTGAPDLTELLRLARGVRGSAQMAGAESVAAVADRLESGLRLVQAGQVAWSDEVRRLSSQTVTDLKTLVRASSRWGQLDPESVNRALDRWNEVAPGSEGGAAADLRMTWQEALAEPSPGGAGAAMPEVAIEALFYDDEGPHVLNEDDEEPMNVSGYGGMAGEPVPIETLLLSATDAAREALAMRDEVERHLREVPGAEIVLGPVVRDLFELIEIAAAEGDAAAG